MKISEAKHIIQERSLLGSSGRDVVAQKYLVRKEQTLSIESGEINKFLLSVSLNPNGQNNLKNKFPEIKSETDEGKLNEFFHQRINDGKLSIKQSQSVKIFTYISQNTIAIRDYNQSRFSLYAGKQDKNYFYNKEIARIVINPSDVPIFLSALKDKDFSGKQQIKYSFFHLTDNGTTLKQFEAKAGTNIENMFQVLQQGFKKYLGFYFSSPFYMYKCNENLWTSNAIQVAGIKGIESEIANINPDYIDSISNTEDDTEIDAGEDDLISAFDFVAKNKATDKDAKIISDYMNISPTDTTKKRPIEKDFKVAMTNIIRSKLKRKV